MAKKTLITATEEKEVSSGGRRADGCQNCKTSRIKCDKLKPSCGCCIRRRETCNYSKIQFNTINKRTHDKRTGRRSKVPGSPMAIVTDRIGSSPTTTTSNSPISTSSSLMRLNIGEVPSPKLSEKSQLLTPATSPTVSGSGSSYRLSNIHQLLCPSDAWIDTSVEAAFSPCPLARPSSALPTPTPLQAAQSEPQGQAIDDDTLHEEISPTWSSFAEALEYQAEMNPNAILSPYSYDQDLSPAMSFGAPRRDFADFTASLDPSVAAILRYSNARLLLHHYLNRSIATLHPQLGCSEYNTSASVFLPYCLSYPVAMEGILAFSASQLSVVDPRQAKAVLYHKTCSIKHLNQLVHQQAFSGASKNATDLSLDLVVSVLSQISMSVTESGVDTWEMHCRAAYSMLSAIPKPEASECSHNLEAYLYCRLLKYLCFAEIARPTARVLDLSLIEGSNLTIEFGVPSGGLKLAVMISQYAYMCETGRASEVVVPFGHQITELLREYLALESFDDVNLLSEYHLMEAIWRSTVWLYYYRCVYNTDPTHDTSVMALSRIVNYLKLIPLESLYSTALAFPVLTIGPLITKENHELRAWLSHHCRRLALSTNTRNFDKIGEFLKNVWAAMDVGECSTINNVRALAVQTGYVILAA